MNVRELEALDIDHIRSYLTHQRWELTKSDDTRQIWTSDHGVHALLPTQKLDDFAELAGRLVEKVAEAQGRDADDILVDISWPGYDKLLARMHINEASPALPIDEAIDATDALRDLIVAAARASEGPQPSFRGGWSYNVSRYYDRVRMIPSVAGSYTLRALLPINPEPPEELLYAQLDTEGVRAVTRTLLAAVFAARSAAAARARGASTGVFDDAVESGVSAELLDALVRLGGPEGHTDDLELGVAWTYSAPEPPSAPIRIDGGLFPVLAEGAAVLREADEDIPATLVGTVTRLHRESSSGPGEVTVQGYLDAGAGSSTRSVKFELDEGSYRDALSAHGAGLTVRVTCTVRFDSPRLTVRGVSRFDVAR